MRYLHAVVKAKKGDSIHVEFSEPTRVLLLTNREYENYKAPKTFKYVGGHMDGTFCDFEVPKNGKYHVVVELGSYFNPMDIKASTTLIPKSYTKVDGEIINDSDEDDHASEENWGDAPAEEDVYEAATNEDVDTSEEENDASEEEDAPEEEVDAEEGNRDY